MDEPENSAAEPPLRTLPVLGGAVLGFAATWFLLTVAILVLYDQQLTGAMEWVVPAVALFGLPVVSALLLIPRSTRRWGAGFLLGVAIGSITGAGVCAGFVGLNSM